MKINSLYLFITALLISPIICWSADFNEQILPEVSIEYEIKKIKRKDSWSSLFPNNIQINMVKKLNRMNVFLKPGMIIIIPKRLNEISELDLAPFPLINPLHKKHVYISLSKLAFGAYDSKGKLLRWGPVSAGANRCLGSETCNTPKGIFHAKLKKGKDCISNHFPLRLDGENGGGEMPYCIYFYKGYALHGSSDIPGFHASQGCIRLFKDDAKWLNEEFIELPKIKQKGTTIFIE